MGRKRSNEDQLDLLCPFCQQNVCSPSYQKRVERSQIDEVYAGFQDKPVFGKPETVECAYHGCLRKFQVYALYANRYRYCSPRCRIKSTGLRPWEDYEIDMLKKWYCGAKPGQVNISRAKAILGRSYASVAMMASKLGVTVGHDNSVSQLSFNMSESALLSGEELHTRRSRRARDRIASRGHPRGMLGKRHSFATKKRISETSKAMWADPSAKCNTAEAKEFRQRLLIERCRAGGMRSGYSRGRGGRREDLDNRYFRSAWEANYARYLNLLLKQGKIARWEYESKVFEFPVKRGTRFYKPDFCVHYENGTYEWHEVKGWMDQRSKTQMKRMAKHHPKEKVVLIGAGWFRQAVKGGLAGALPMWEYDGKPRFKAGVTHDFSVEAAVPHVEVEL